MSHLHSSRPWWNCKTEVCALLMIALISAGCSGNKSSDSQCRDDKDNENAKPDESGKIVVGAFELHELKSAWECRQTFASRLIWCMGSDDNELYFASRVTDDVYHVSLSKFSREDALAFQKEKDAKLSNEQPQAMPALEHSREFLNWRKSVAITPLSEQDNEVIKQPDRKDEPMIIRELNRDELSFLTWLLEQRRELERRLELLHQKLREVEGLMRRLRRIEDEEKPRPNPQENDRIIVRGRKNYI